MDTAALPSRISRVDTRYRHWARNVSPKKEAEQEQESEEEEAPLHDGVGEPLLIREQKGRVVMGRAHRDFHRRAAQEASNILTIPVEVVATLDESGNIIGQQTVTASIPGVPAVPTAPLPSVPSVPAFPSDLTVPAYPWPSGVPSATAQTATTGSQVVTSAPVSATTEESSVLPTAFPSSSGFNSTASSTIISSTTFSSSSSSLNSTITSSSRSSTRSSTSSTRTSTSISLTSTPISATSSAAASSSGGGGGGGGFNPGNTASPPEASNTAAASEDQSDSGALGTPEVVGTVFGSLAGAAILLALILLLIRRHKRKQRGGAMQLTGDDADNQPMTQRDARTSFVPPSFLNRFSGASRSTAESSATGERGFQRISGRKLPSAFSEGMTSEQFAPRGEGTLSGSSFYQDERGVYGGPGFIPKDFGKETGEPTRSGTVGSKERVMPSPARTPVIHHPDEAPAFGSPRNGGGSTLSPPTTPNNPEHTPRGTLGRSHPSHDGSRSSRFTENV